MITGPYVTVCLKPSKYLTLRLLLTTLQYAGSLPFTTTFVDVTPANADLVTNIKHGLCSLGTRLSSTKLQVPAAGIFGLGVATQRLRVC